MGSGADVLKYRFQWNFPIVFSPHDPNTLYLAASGGGADTIHYWTINWGDGETQNVPAPGSPASITPLPL